MSVIAALPDWKVTTGVAIASEAVSVRVTTSSALAKVVVELLEAMLTELSVGAVPSYNQLIEVLVLVLLAASVNAPPATFIATTPLAVGVKVAV